MTEAVTIPYISEGLINLGPANPSALNRLANYAQSIINNGQPLPKSPFCEWAADRITGDDRQDLVFFLQGRRGSGKSYSFLYLGKRLAEAVARRKGGVWQDYFSMSSCCTLDDNEKIMRVIESTGLYNILLIDDCALAISNRSWASPQNKNFNALLSVARTKRLCLLMTAPLKKMVDNQVREMSDLTRTVYKSFHKGGMNILKITSSEISTAGKEYSHKMNFSKRKVDYWVTFRPDPELTKAYDIQRDESAIRLNKRIIETGSYKGSTKPKEPSKTLAERNLEKLVTMHGEEIREFIAKNPKASMNRISSKFCMTPVRMSRVVEALGLTVEPKGREQ